MFAVVFRFVTGSIVDVMSVVPFSDADDELSKIQSEIKIKEYKYFQLCLCSALAQML